MDYENVNAYSKYRYKKATLFFDDLYILFHIVFWGGCKNVVYFVYRFVETKIPPYERTV